MRKKTNPLLQIPANDLRKCLASALKTASQIATHSFELHLTDRREPCPIELFPPSTRLRDRNYDLRRIEKQQMRQEWQELRAQQKRDKQAKKK